MAGQNRYCDDFTRLVEFSEVKTLLFNIFGKAQTPPSADEEKHCHDAGTKNYIRKNIDLTVTPIVVLAVALLLRSL